jgi:hypothetical protein
VSLVGRRLVEEVVMTLMGRRFVEEVVMTLMGRRLVEEVVMKNTMTATSVTAPSPRMVSVVVVTFVMLPMLG